MLFSPIKGEGTDSTNSIDQAAQAWSSAASNTLLMWWFELPQGLLLCVQPNKQSIEKLLITTFQASVV